MLSDETIRDLEAAVDACNDARAKLEKTLSTAESRADGATADPVLLEEVGNALSDWRDAEQRFMDVVDQSGVPNPSTASLLLKTNHGIDSSNARRGIPGTSVDGADQPFDVEMSGVRGSVITEAAIEYME